MPAVVHAPRRWRFCGWAVALASVAAGANSRAAEPAPAGGGAGGVAHSAAALPQATAITAESATVELLNDSGVTGGLIVHLGCGDGRQTVALARGHAFLVQGLDGAAENIAAARQLLAGDAPDAGLAGRVAFERWAGPALPYVDNLVNLLIDRAGTVERAELLRALAPGGVAYSRRDGRWTKIVKPRPDDIDEWTHFLHGPDNNPVAADKEVGEPRYMQWVTGPEHGRSHEHFQTLSAAVSARGRLFTIIDEGPIVTVALPAEVSLIARDAFNGLELWRRPIAKWESHLREFRGGPGWIGRRLVAVDDRLYVTLGYGEPVTILNAATGAEIGRFAGTEQASEIVVDRGVLFVVISDLEAQAAADKARRHGIEAREPGQRIMAFDTISRKKLWEVARPLTQKVMPTSLAVQRDRAFFQNQEAVVCIDAATGQPRWVQKRSTGETIRPESPPTLVVHDDVVLSADPSAPALPPDPNEVQPPRENRLAEHGGELIALAVGDGKLLWRAPCYPNFRSAVDILVVDGMVWSGQMWSVVDMGVTSARDLHTGKITRTRPADNPDKIVVSHHRCHRIRATENFLMLSRAGIELLDVKTGMMQMNHWVRGTCQHGPIPCNGLIYAPPHSCACYPLATIHGFTSLAAVREKLPPPDKGFEQGPAFGSVAPGASEAVATDWPTYRGNAARNGANRAKVPAALTPKWERKLAGRLSALTVAAGQVYVAAIDANTVHAFRAATGDPAWSFTAGGRVDSPPTFDRGAVYFGCADGWVYCLRAADGALAWRFRAAPCDRRLVANGGVESVWPVHGSVLVRGGRVYCAAGRSSFLDGGMWLIQLDAATGRELARVQVDSRDPETGVQPKDAVNGFDMPGLLNDIFAAEGDRLFLRQTVFSPEFKQLNDRVAHLFSPTGFLDGSWWHRTYWVLGPQMYAGFKDWAQASDEVPFGRLFSLGDGVAFGFGRTKAARFASHVGIDDTEYRLFSISAEPADWQAWVKRPEPNKSAVRYRWQVKTPVLVRAMVLADKTLFVAGPPDLLERKNAEATDALMGKLGGSLQAISPQDGKVLAKYPLGSPPVFDGLAAAGGRLFFATLDGHLVCYGAVADGGR